MDASLSALRFMCVTNLLASLHSVYITVSSQRTTTCVTISSALHSVCVTEPLSALDYVCVTEPLSVSRPECTLRTCPGVRGPVSGDWQQAPFWTPVRAAALVRLKERV